MSRGLGASAVLVLLAGATELVVFSDGQGPIRISLVLAFLGIAPGWAILRLVDLEMAPSARIGIAIGVSAGLDMAVASALLYGRLWSADLALTILVGIVIVAVLLGLPSARRTIVTTARQARAALSELDNQ
jgi:hypothetical protein